MAYADMLAVEATLNLRVARTACLVAAVGCANAARSAPSPVALTHVVLCQITMTADGRDIDDGPAAVDLVVEGERPRRARLARVPRTCERSDATHAVCTDPHGDSPASVVVTRTAEGVVVEVTRDAAPLARQVVASDPRAQVDIQIAGACEREPR